jgi:predicted nucleic acid-binding protein
VIAIDTSTLIAYLAGEPGRDVELLDQALADRRVQLPPVVVAEILSAPSTATAAQALERLIMALPRLEIGEGYWERAGRGRRRLLALRLKAPLADALICQSCLDHDLPLLTRDADFRPFAKHGGLKLA